MFRPRVWARVNERHANARAMHACHAAHVLPSWAASCALAPSHPHQLKTATPIKPHLAEVARALVRANGIVVVDGASPCTAHTEHCTITITRYAASFCMTKYRCNNHRAPNPVTYTIVRAERRLYFMLTLQPSWGSGTPSRPALGQLSHAHTCCSFIAVR